MNKEFQRTIKYFQYPLMVPTIYSQELNETGTFIDPRDGQEYKWVKIGEQIWMAENLNYDNGKGCCVYMEKSSYADTYGRLYFWDTCNVCPDGWHLPNGFNLLYFREC